MRFRRLIADQEAAVRVLAATRSLLVLAAEFGVGHETVRAVVRRGRRRPDEPAVARRPRPGA